MILRYLFFDVSPVSIFKSDVTIMEYVNRVKPFDVLIKNRMPIMTSIVRSTQLVGEAEKRGVNLGERPPSEEVLPP